MTFLTWNTAHRVARASEQVAVLAARTPDIVALQEVTANTLAILRPTLVGCGLTEIVTSWDHAPPGSYTGPRQYGVLIAARVPLKRLDPGLVLPWPEKGVSVRATLPQGPIEVHNVHIPPGSSNGWIKIETFEGVYRSLARASEAPRILCGDFNSPKEEHPTGELVTWAQTAQADGSVKLRQQLRGGSGQRWDAGERNVLRGLAGFDLADVYRALRGHHDTGYSFVLERAGKTVRRRFDHVLASAALGPTEADYLHDFRERGLSDHAPLEVIFGWGR